MHEMTWEDINAFLTDGFEVEIIDTQHPRINQALEVILTIQYTSIDGNVMVYTIVGQKDVDKM